VHIDILLLIVLGGLAAWTELDKLKRRRTLDSETGNHDNGSLDQPVVLSVQTTTAR
jgi:hypothetical protein